MHAGKKRGVRGRGGHLHDIRLREPGRVVHHVTYSIRVIRGLVDRR